MSQILKHKDRYKVEISDLPPVFAFNDDFEAFVSENIGTAIEVLDRKEYRKPQMGRTRHDRNLVTTD